MSEHNPDMTRTNLAIKNINIARMPGIRGEYHIDPLSPGINLVHGPNGIGKSRTAQALQALIWPAPFADQVSIIGNLHVAGDTWNVGLDIGKAVYQKNSASVSGFSFATPPDTHRDRYLLTLQDLLRVENRNFAVEIHRQASGGYDLERVRTAMSIPVAAKKYRPSKSDKPLQAIRNELHRLRQLDGNLRDQEKSLDHLKAQHLETVAATNRLTELENARTYRQACDDLETARRRMDSFEAPVRGLIGNEFGRAEKLIQELTGKQEQHREYSARVLSLKEEIRTTGLSGDGLSATVISGLRNRLQDLQEQESELRRTEIEIAQHVDTLSAHRNRLRRDLTEEQMQRLDAAGLRDLAKLSHKWQQAQNTLLNQNDLQEWLGNPVEWNRESLRTGAELLTRYTQTQNAGPETSRSKMVVFALIGAAIVIVTAASLLATSLSQYSLLLAVAALPLLWLAFTARSDRNEAELKQIQSRYLSLDLPEPATWTTDDVFRTLQRVQGTAAKAELEHERAMRWGDLQGKRQQIAAGLQELNNQRASYTREYGVELVEAVPESLNTIANALDNWRQATDQLTNAKSRKSTLESRRSSVLSTIGSELQLYGLHADMHDGTSAHAAIEELDQRITSASRAAEALKHTSERLENDINPQISALGEELAAMYNKSGLELKDQVGLKRLCEQVEPYTAARNAVSSAETAVATLRSKLRHNSGDENLDQAAIERAIASATELANQRDRIQAEISRIETETDGARHQTQIESVLARERAALDVLSDRRLQDYASAADQMVFELVQNRHREANQPPVFRSADDLFTSFTNGTYRLHLDEGSSEFTAIEADTGQSVVLDKLSSGTRVQLLLAVRLAFIEASENGLQLPLIMDETLGNTDDTRARAIIDATIEIARRGRQVLYFTAQHDEIGKWSAALNSLEDRLEWSVIDLAGIRGKASAKPRHSYSWDSSAFASVSVPEGADLNALREHLGVSSIDIQTANVSEVDLWYLIPETEPLVALRQRGVRAWGQYLNLYRSNHLQGIWSESIHNRALARAQVIEQFCNAWREGRPEPLTVSELRNSGKITDRFWNEIVICAEENNWDGSALIRALDEGAVRGFRRAACDQLTDWLTDNGFITQTQPLDDATIRARVMSSVYDAIEKEIIGIHEIDEIIRHLVDQPVSKAQAS